MSGAKHTHLLHAWFHWICHHKMRHQCLKLPHRSFWWTKEKAGSGFQGALEVILFLSRVSKLTDFTFLTCYIWYYKISIVSVTFIKTFWTKFCHVCPKYSLSFRWRNHLFHFKWLYFIHLGCNCHKTVLLAWSTQLNGAFRFCRRRFWALGTDKFSLKHLSVHLL